MRLKAGTRTWKLLQAKQWHSDRAGRAHKILTKVVKQLGLGYRLKEREDSGLTLGFLAIHRVENRFYVEGQGVTLILFVIYILPHI